MDFRSNNAKKKGLFFLLEPVFNISDATVENIITMPAVELNQLLKRVCEDLLILRFTLLI